MRVKYGRAKFCGFLLLLTGLFVVVSQAFAQSTDSCENINGTWYKFCLDCTHGTHPGTGKIWPARDAMLAPWYSLDHGWWACPSPSDTSNYHCRPTCLPSINLRMIGVTDIRARYTGAGTIAGVSCGNLGVEYNATAAGVFNRQAQTNPAVQCPANPPPSFKTDDSCGRNNPRLGNSCAPASGTKYLDEVDYVGASGLELRRSYATARSYSSDTTPINPAFGSASWLHNYERSLHVVNTAQNGGVKWIVQRQDGSLLYFRADGTELLNRSDTGAASTITTLPNNTGWELRLADGSVERFNFNGRLISITSRSGVVTTITYNSMA